MHGVDKLRVMTVYAYLFTSRINTLGKSKDNHLQFSLVRSQKYHEGPVLVPVWGFQYHLWTWCGMQSIIGYTYRLVRWPHCRIISPAKLLNCPKINISEKSKGVSSRWFLSFSLAHWKHCCYVGSMYRRFQVIVAQPQWYRLVLAQAHGVLGLPTVMFEEWALMGTDMCRSREDLRIPKCLLFT